LEQNRQIREKMKFFQVFLHMFCKNRLEHRISKVRSFGFDGEDEDDSAERAINLFKGIVIPKAKKPSETAFFRIKALSNRLKNAFLCLDALSNDLENAFICLEASADGLENAFIRLDASSDRLENAFIRLDASSNRLENAFIRLDASSNGLENAFIRVKTLSNPSETTFTQKKHLPTEKFKDKNLFAIFEDDVNLDEDLRVRHCELRKMKQEAIRKSLICRLLDCFTAFAMTNTEGLSKSLYIHIYLYVTKFRHW
jgi:hypothetical protein